MHPSDLVGIPTDSLYKYLAISGVVLVVATGYAFLRFIYDLSIRVYETRRKHDDAVARLSFLQRKAEIMLEAHGSQPPPELKVELLEDQDELARSVNDVGVHLKTVEYLSGFKKQAIRGFWFALVTGVLMASTGFNLWYLRVQVFQDRMLRAQAEQAFALDSPRPSAVPAPERIADPQSEPQIDSTLSRPPEPRVPDSKGAEDTESRPPSAEP